MFLNYRDPSFVSDAAEYRFGSPFVFLVDRVKECMTADFLARASAEQMATSCWAHCHGVVALRLDGLLFHLDDGEFEEFYEASCNSLRHGLKAAPIC